MCRSRRELVNKAGAALSEIVESINEVAEVVSGIAAAGVEQSTDIEQVNKALAQMDKVTQPNSALVEENAATAKTFGNQSRAMNDRVAVFLIDDMPAAGAARSATMSKPPVEVRPKSAAPAAKQPAAAPRRGLGGPARKMQTALAAAVNLDSRDF
jgi:methyl-accepting chemotaxis protein